MTGVQRPPRAGLIVPVARGVLSTAGVATAAAGFFGLIGGWLTPTGLVLIGVAAGPVLAGKVIDAHRDRLRSIEASQERLRSLLRTAQPIPVADTSAYELGVLASALAQETTVGDRPPYVPRAIDRHLDAALAPAALEANQRLVVVRGDPLTGKSRTLAEALYRNVGERVLYPLISPTGDAESPQARPLDAFLELKLDVAGIDMVVWIDDAGGHSQRGLSHRNLRRLIESYPGVIVAITISNRDLGQLGDRQLEQLLRRTSDRHELDPKLTADEHSDARRLYPALAEKDELADLPEWLAAVDLLWDQYRSSRSSHPVGMAVAKAALDWRRVALIRPIPRDQLRQLAALELELLAPAQHMSDDDFTAGLAWATAPVGRWAALVRPVLGTDHTQFRAFDALVNWAERVDGTIDEQCWQFIVDHTTTSHRAALSPAQRLKESADQLWLALGDGSIEVEYQPKLEIITGIVRGVEALPRWNHPTRGLIRPARLLRVAEHSGAIRLLTILIVQTALNQCRQWRDRHGWDLGVAVNLSAHNLVDDLFLSDLESLLEESPIPPSRLTLELNETVVHDQLSRVSVVANRLADLGVRLSLDDFGSHDGSLSRLRQLLVSEIKIARPYVVNMNARRTERAMVQDLLRMARRLELTTVAVGVHDRSVWDLLQAFGCDQAQGHLVAEPQPPDKLTGWLQGQPPDRIPRTH